MYMNLAARRRRKAGGGAPPPPLEPPVNTTGPRIQLTPDMLQIIYTPGVWTGEPDPTITARLWQFTTDLGPATPLITILPEWREVNVEVRETADNGVGDPVLVFSNGLPLPYLATGPMGLDAVSTIRATPGRSGQIRVTNGLPPFTTDAAWPITFSAWSRDGNWSGAAIPDGPQIVTITDALGESIRVTFDYTGLVAPDTRPIALVALPANTTPPDLDLSPDNSTLLYTPGVWTGAPAPAITARLFVQGVDTAPAAPSMPVQPEWRGKQCGIREEANSAAGGPVFALSPEVLPPALPSLDAQVQAILAGTSGFVFDPQDDASLSLIHNGPSPISGPGDPIGRILSRTGFGAGPSRQSFNATVAARPVLQVDRTLLFDGLDDGLATGSQNFMGNNVPAASIFMIIRPLAAALTGYHAILFAQTGEAAGNQNERFGLHLQDGNLVATCRRTDTDAAVTATSPADLVAEQVYVVGMTCDFAGASPILRLWVDDVEVASAPIPGTPGNTSATQNIRTGLGIRHTTPGRFAGGIGRLLYAPLLLTGPQRATVEAWLSDGPFDPSPIDPGPPVVTPWAPPVDITSAPSFGATVEHNGTAWRNILVTTNLWEPGIFGWEAVT